MHGTGTLFYNPDKPREVDMKYEGQFHLNLRHGEGILTKLNGDVVQGSFQNNWPNGETEIFFSNGDYYRGEVVKNNIVGNGYLKCADGQSF